MFDIERPISSALPVSVVLFASWNERVLLLVGISLRPVVVDHDQTEHCERRWCRCNIDLVVYDLYLIFLLMCGEYEFHS